MSLRGSIARLLLHPRSRCPLPTYLTSSSLSSSAGQEDDFDIEEILRRKGAIEGTVDPMEIPRKLPPVEQRELDTELVPDEPFIVHEASGVPKEHVKDRLVRVAKATKNATQSGTHNTHAWVLSFDNRPRWENNLMGWVSSGDPLSNLQLRFDTKEEAVEFCKKHTYPYYVVEEKPVSPKNRSYASNFSWNKRSRVSTK